MTPKPSPHRPTIGVLTGWSVFTGTLDPFLAHVIEAIQAAAQDLDCNLLLACGIESSVPAWPLISPHVDFIPVGPQNTDGLVIVSPFASSAGERYARNLVESGFPVVYAGDRDSGPAVVADNAGGIRQAVAHLVAHGHRRIAYVAGRLHSEHGDSGLRQQAFQHAMTAHGLFYDPALVEYGLHTYDGGRQAIQKILNKGLPFTAVVASNDGSAMGVLDGLKRAGLVVPQDVALIGFDDRLEARAQVPPLTTVHYPTYSLGYQSVALLLRAIHGEPVEDELVQIPTSLVVRESCGCGPGVQIRGTEGTGEMAIPLETHPEAVLSRLSNAITAAVTCESRWMSQGEIAYLGIRLVEAFVHSLGDGDPQIFLQVFKQILERVSARGENLFIWQAALTLLRRHLPAIHHAFPTQMTAQEQEELIHRGRVAIGDVALVQFTRTLIKQTHEADRVGLMTSKFFAAHEEAEIFAQLARDLPAIGIQHAVVGYYQSESDDPVAWSLLQTPGCPGADRPALPVGARFLSLQFPPGGLYDRRQAYQLALLPLKIEGTLSGFVAFEAGNLDPCAEIVRHLGAALRSVRLYREAVDARRQAEEGKRLAEEANRLKSRFLSMVSHELRTPLNLITGLSNILLEEYRHESPARPGEYTHSFEEDLNRIYLSAQHLDGLIRDVLDLASSDVGQLKLVCEPLDMREVLSAVAAIGMQLAREKGLAWQMEIPENLPRVWGDRTRLRQVALNLVNNAVKFTSHGGISLTAMVEDSQVVVHVKDTGLGIPLHEQDVIFDEFRRSERATSRGYGGLGLGLAICRKLVEMHGGQIGVCSSGDEGQGSLFSFSLPVYQRQLDLGEAVIPIFEGRRVLL
ncbi:MAG: substrate-binding domain-containing protein, partial [Anaerolineae bacterium]